MKNMYRIGASLVALASLTAPGFADDAAEAPEPTALQDVIVVTGRPLTTPNLLETRPDAVPDFAPDAVAIIGRVPGADIIDNGSISGQVSYRGMFGPRINLRVDGQSFASGGPNLMDPPLHYAPTPLIDHISIDRGVSPVSAGPGLAGGADAVLKTIDFADSSDLTFGYDLSGAYRTAGDSSAVGGVVGASSDRFRFHVLGSVEQSDDIDFPDGTINNTSHEREVYGVSTGVKLGDHTFGLDYRHQDTGDTGNPPFPMDIKYFDTDFARLSYHGALGEVELEGHLSFVDVAHLMTNFHLRPAPANMMMWRQNNADATTVSGDFSAGFEFGPGQLTLGVDADKVDKNALISNPNNDAFFLASLPDIAEERFGGFAEWGGVMHNHNAELGLRVDSYEKSAGLASTGPAVPMMPTMLANQFNASDRDWDAVTTDAVARVWRDVDDGLTVRGTFARKQRAPGYVEVFSWLPTGASGGLADGNIYVGDQDLDVETIWVTELGVDWMNDRAYARPTLVYRSIDDYITGAPFDDTVGVIDNPVEMVANMNGDSTPLIWTNVDARIYGFDMDAGYRISDHWRVDGTLSWLTGERRDIDDHLYRFAPPNLSLALTHERDAWSVSVETIVFDEQDDVSVANSEATTPGYAVMNLYGSWTITDGVSLSAGVENLLDHTYRDHLAGYNRVRGSDVDLGQRLPGAGRNAFVRLTFAR